MSGKQCIEWTSVEWRITATPRTLCIFPLCHMFDLLMTTVCFGRYGASISQHGILLYDDTQFLLALACADNAIWGINSFNDFWQLKIPDGDDELPLWWKDSVMALSILRNATMQQGVTDEPLLKRTFNCIIKSVLNLSGYFGNATVRAIRRCLGKKVNGKWYRKTSRTWSSNKRLSRKVHWSRTISTYQSDRSSCLWPKLRGQHLVCLWEIRFFEWSCPAWPRRLFPILCKISRKGPSH